VTIPPTTTETGPPKTASFQFIGTATCLLRYGALTLLTDPNFLHQGQRAYLGLGLTSKRLTEPALRVDELPELDAVVLSHLHGDHWDRVAAKGLRSDLPILTTPHASRRLQWRGFPRATGLQTWSSTTVHRGGDQVRITSLPGRHAPLPLQRLHVLPPVMGSLWEFGPVDGPVRLRVYVSGDTLLVPEVRAIPLRFPDIDVGVLHLGGTRLPGGVLVTMDDQQGADLMDLVDPRTTIPIHFDDYSLFTSPRSDFETEVRRRGHADRLTVVDRGDTVDLTPWCR
jgi:L-ascorbate metabolism protein UlaG (beta-lactamase superfamily)